MTNELEDLRATLIRHYTEYAGSSPERAEYLANLALSGISVAFPEGWEIIPERTELECVLVQGDGIEDGVSRMELIRQAANVGEEPRPGRETTVRYRGADLDLTEGVGDVYAVLSHEDALYSTFHLENTDDGGSVAKFVRDIDFVIDMIQQDTTTEQETQS